jgi:hypothetical protein
MSENEPTIRMVYELLISTTTGIKQDITGIKQDITGMKQDITGMKQDITGMKKDITGLKSDMRGIKDYLKKESDIQEISNKQFISKLYKYNYPMHNVISVPLKNFYHPANQNPITDFDGFLFVSNKVVYHKKNVSSLLKNVHKQNENVPYASPARELLSEQKENQSNTSPNHNQFILIESKHSLSKGKVDTKIKQLVAIKEVFEHAQEQEEKQVHSRYSQMIATLLESTEQSIDEINIPVNLIFSSDDISQELLDYVLGIYRGMNESSYDLFTSELFHSDMYVKQYLKEIHTTTEIPLLLKNALKNAKTMKESRNALRIIFRYINPETEEDRKRKEEIDVKRKIKEKTEEELKREEELKSHYRRIESYMSEYLIEFTALEDAFQKAKGRVGVAQFNTLYFPSLFYKSTLNA